MRVIFKKRIYNIQWPKKFDRIIKKVAQLYKLPNGYISWKTAETNGTLRGLPKFLTYRDLSHRYYYLRNHKTKKYKERHRIKQEKYLKNTKLVKKNNKKRLITKKRKKILFNKYIPINIKRKYGWKSRTVWTPQQKKILDILTKKYRKSKITIDWENLVKDSKVKKFPTQDRFKLMKYYGQCNRAKQRTKKEKEKKVKDAIQYNKRNYTKYLHNLDRIIKYKNNSVNDFLLTKIPLR